MSKELSTHLREHVSKWPATREDIVSACNNISDIPDEERKWVLKNLPAGTYDAPEDAEQVMLRGSVQG